jgi:hypothetical protein
MEIVLNFFNYHKDNIIFFEFRIRCIMLILGNLRISMQWFIQYSLISYLLG